MRAVRLNRLPPYLFVEIDRRKRAAREAGRDIIDFGVGDPDQPTPAFIVNAMKEAVHEARHHRYAPGVGYPEFREAAARFFQRRFGVELDPTKEVISVIGSKEALGHLPLAVVNPNDVALIPQPGYPVYESATLFAGGVPFAMPLRERNGWLPAFEEIPQDVLRRAKLMFLNYPNNPTSATATMDFLEKAVWVARSHEILIVHDAAYAEVYFEKPPPSILQVEGASDVSVEFHSLSKTFNMTGWRIGFAVGHADVLAALAAVKSNVDSGVFGAIQQAGTVALNRYDRPEISAQRELYLRRRDVLVAGLREAGWHAIAPRATFFVWVACPGGVDSMAVCSRLLEEADIVAVPGIGFGEHGEGFVRFALTVDEMRIREACTRIARLEWAPLPR